MEKAVEHHQPLKIAKEAIALAQAEAEKEEKEFSTPLLSHRGARPAFRTVADGICVEFTPIHCLVSRQPTFASLGSGSSTNSGSDAEQLFRQQQSIDKQLKELQITEKAKQEKHEQARAVMLKGKNVMMYAVLKLSGLTTLG